MALPDQARIVAQQLGNAYGLLFMVGIAVLYTGTELKVVRNYLVALLIADIGHVGLTIAALGPDRFAAVGDWNAMTWGNVGFTVCLDGSDKKKLFLFLTFYLFHLQPRPPPFNLPFLFLSSSVVCLAIFCLSPASRTVLDQELLRKRTSAARKTFFSSLPLLQFSRPSDN